MFGALTENGPCNVGDDSAKISTNDYSWTKHANMLYIDQPVQTGFSYDVLTNGNLNLINGSITVQSADAQLSDQLGLNGTFSSQKPTSTANTTTNAARHLWNFAQVWLQEFDVYRKKSRNDRVSIWTESYGGRYGPGFAAYFHEQNGKINGKSGAFEPINLDTLGVINGCIDLLTQELSDPEYAYNENTFGIRAIEESQFDAAVEAYNKPGGCKEQIGTCLKLAEEKDPDMYGNVTEVNQHCFNASTYCQAEVEAPYIFTSKRGFYDISHCYLDPFPPNYFLGYLTRADVQQALGVPVNFTLISNSVAKAFNDTGDYPRRDRKGYLGDIGYLLDAGVQVALIYGDRDFACNWVGGERASLNVSYLSSSKFKEAGYANITSTNSTIWGQVRQHGKFSFSRVYQSGHMVPAYQPEAALEIFRRVMDDRDVATGNSSIIESYSTDGASKSTHTDNAPDAPAPTCYLLALSGTCSENQIEAVKNGSAKVKDYVITDPVQSGDACPYTFAASNNSFTDVGFSCIHLLSRLLRRLGYGKKDWTQSYLSSTYLRSFF